MAAQASPSYTNATRASDPIILKHLIAKYGANNVVWPLVLSANDKLICYVYERNRYRGINSSTSNHPSSAIPSCFIDYTSNPRTISPKLDILEPFIQPDYLCSYDYIVSTPLPYSTVDLDYVWKDGENQWRGFELTTFWKPFTDAREAERLVRQINKRPSWRGPDEAHALRKIVAAAEDLKIKYYLACANTVSKVGSDLKTDGNVYFFQLNNKQIDNLEKGAQPDNPKFCSFKDFIKRL